MVNDGGYSLAVAAKLVLDATSYVEIFGDLGKDNTTRQKNLNREYRRIARVLHPDLYPDPDQKALAEQAFTRMTDMHHKAHDAINNDTYGEVKPLAEIETKLATHRIIKGFATGDIADVYLAESEIAGATTPTLVKIVRSSIDNDLMQAEEKALRILGSDTAEEQWRPFVSTLVDSFAFAETGKPNRQANVIALVDKNFVNLAQLKDEYFPRGLDPKHMAWIWRRLLCAIGFAHDNGIVHGAVVPTNILIEPEKHGVILIDWCYSSTEKKSALTPIQAVVDKYRDWYPLEVTEKISPNAGTDIAMAARSMIFLCGGNPLTGELPDSIPVPMQRHFKGCIVASQMGRPDNAFRLLAEFDDLLENLGKPFHPRVFRPLQLTDSIVR